MIGYKGQIDCRQCNRETYLEHSGYYDDGSQRLLCSCRKDGGVLHSCAYGSPLTSPAWLPLVMAGVGIICPQCKKVYDLGVTIEPVYPQAGEVLKVVGFFAGVLVAIGLVNDLLQGRKGRRR
jgi:hypothetical protein